MATFRKRGNKWVAEVCVSGNRRSKTHLSKAEAKHWASQQEHELAQLATGVSTTHTFGDVLRRYATEVSELKKGSRWELLRLNNIGKDVIANVKLMDLHREHFQRWIQRRLATGIQPSSVNRELNLLSHCLTQARRWSLMKDNPMTDLMRPKNPPHRDRRISNDEQEAILISLGYSEAGNVALQQQRVAVAFLFALQTAMRAGEICALQPEHVNFPARTVFLADTKNGHARYVPLSLEAMRLLKRLQPWGDTVFGLKSGVLSTLFKRGVSRAGIENLVFHDTRHEAITRLAKKLDVLELARMVGHRDIKQLMTYYNKTASELAPQLD